MRLIICLPPPRADVWLSAAIDLLDFLPDQLVVEVSRELPTLSYEEEDGQVRPSGHDECKLLLFHVLDKHYGHMDRKPLLCDSMTDVYTEIMELLGKANAPQMIHSFQKTMCLNICLPVYLVKGKFEQALEVLQLTLKLLSASAREELRRLLEFMAASADAANVRLHKEVRSHNACDKLFTSHLPCLLWQAILA